MTWFGRAAQALTKFDPNEPRDPSGEWSSGGGQLADRYDLGRKIGDSSVTTAQLYAHPAVRLAEKRIDELQPTSERAGYGTPKYEAAREFSIDGHKVVGYDKAVDLLVKKASQYAPGGIVKCDKQAYIVIGPPAAGKSSLAERIALRENAAIIDSDDVKKTLPEYEGGVGANAVHEESSRIAEGLVSEKLLAKGSNVILPKVGDNVRSISKKIDGLKALGYDVHLVNMKVSSDNAARRMLARFVSSGRLISPSYFHSIGEKPKATYEKLKGDSRVGSHAEVDNDGALGSPQHTEGSGKAFEAVRA